MYLEESLKKILETLEKILLLTEERMYLEAKEQMQFDFTGVPDVPKYEEAKDINEVEESKQEVLDRKSIKAQLDAKGIEYNNKQSTKTLLNILEKDSTKEDAVVEKEAPIIEKPVVEEKKETPKSVSVDTVRDKLKCFARSYGPEKAINLLDKFRAKKVSDLNNEQMEELINIIEDLGVAA